VERITIVGMGPIGASIGLGLKRSRLADTEIVGTAADRKALSTAVKMGAMDRTEVNLSSALNGAKLVIVDMPLAESRSFLETMGPAMDDGCVVTDVGTTKIRIMDWAAEFLPREVTFIGGHPLLKNPPRELEDADAKLLSGVDYAVIPAKSATSDSVRTVVGMVEALDANPLFLDASEHDSYAAAMIYLPIVLSSAFVTATAGSESWREMHRLAASEFADLSGPASNDPQDNEDACFANPDALVHWLDEMITELYSYRNQIKDRSDNLLEPFVRAWEARARWEANAVVESAESNLPSSADAMASVFMGQRLVDRYREMRSGDTKKHSWKYNK